MSKSKFLVSLAFITLLFWGVSANSSILVIAPHPDDDVLIAAGITYAATQRGEPITIVYMTNGDVGGPGDLRQDEAVSGQINNLGTKESNLIFLGYPDGGLQTMYQQYPGQSDLFLAPSGRTATYAHRGLGGTDYHNFRYGAHANYNGYNILNDLKDVINTLRPDHIITTAEFDTHWDHYTTYYITRDAILGVTAADPSYVPVLNKSVVHAPGWPAPNNPLSYFTEPPGLSGTGFAFANRESLDVPLAMQVAGTGNLKYLAVAAHVSQGGSDINGFLGSFIHKDEFFWPVSFNGNNSPPRVNAGMDQTVTQESAVVLDGSASNDPNGAQLSYQWRQVAGPSVVLADATTASPHFTAPSGLATQITLAFELVVDDGRLNSLPDHVSVNVLPGTLTSSNIASLAMVSASSQNTSTGQTASKAVDGVIDGVGGVPGDYSREWATVNGGAGSWIELDWGSAYQVSQVILYDRPNSDDQITGATLTFSDGSIVTVGALNNNGTGVTVNFAPVITNSVRVTVTSVSGTTLNIGLAELEVYGMLPTGNNLQPVANAGPDQTVDQGALVNLNGSASSDPNGDNLSYQWTQTAGPSVSLLGANTATPSFTAPSGLTSTTKLTFALIVNDGQLNSLPDSVDINVTATSGSGSNIASLASVTASSESTGTSQQAIKAVDGVIDGVGGVPGDYTREWATVNGGAGSWIELDWDSAYQVNQVILYDRPNSDDQITGATLTFSDGSIVTVGALNNNGTGVTVNFAPVITNSVRVTVTSVSGTTLNIGLAELEVYGVSQTSGSNISPAFVGGTTTLTVNMNSAAVSLKPNLHVSDTDSGQTETWSQGIVPAHGDLVFSGATAGSGSADITPGGTITYQPAAGYSGSDSFSVQVSDGSAMATRTFVVNVVAANTAPTFVGGTTTLSVTRNSAAVSLKPNLHVSDIDTGQTETWSQNVPPAHGMLVFSGATAKSGSTNITPGGTITYKPATGYRGSDSFTVQVRDGVATATRSFTVTVK